MADEKTTIGTAYVQILPSTEGIKSALENALGGVSSEVGQSAGGRMGGALSGALGTALKGAGVAIGAAATAVGGLVKSAVEGYADYEQLIGGVETLFGSSADVVEAYAENAFRTAGLSANDYMETVTGFSASLLQSLGGDTAAAADYADMAITDMADNANKMGSSMESIQNAYQGFAKQNYTMLDNLKLGYGGTKEEMQRLLDDAAAISGIKYDISSYADVVEAIHIIQAEMGIAGTTAAEASGTISGSVAAMGAAWQNLVAGIADENADFGALVDNFVDSALTVGDNLIPRVEQALTGVGSLVEGLAPVITGALPGLIANVLPSLLESAASLVGTIGQALIDNLPMLLTVGLDLVLMLAQGIGDSLPELIPALVEVVLQIVQTLTEPSTMASLVEAAFAIIAGLAKGLINAIPELVMTVPQLIAALVRSITTQAVNLVNVGRELVTRVRQGFMELVGSAVNWGRDLVQNFINGLTQKWSSLSSAVSGLAGTIAGYLHFSEPDVGPLADFHTYAPDMMELFTQGIRDSEGMLRRQIERTFDLGGLITSAPTALIGEPQGAARTETAGERTQAQPQEFTFILRLPDDSELGRWVYRTYNDQALMAGPRLAGGLA